MSVLGNNILAGASGQGGYFIDRSLRFRSSASAYLSRTTASSGNLNKWTISFWIKKAFVDSSTQGTVIGCQADGNNFFYVRFSGGTTFNSRIRIAGTDYETNWNPSFRDPSAWYHFVYVYDRQNGTTADKQILYVNGVRQTTSSAANPATDSTSWNVNGITHYIGYAPNNPVYFDGYMTEINFIDGQALTPDSFGEYNATTGVWQPIKYTGTYGTNGFYLNFSDNSTTTTLGYDTSGNGNNWTANNISVTSGVTYDSMTDVPTLTSEDAANFCTWNPLVGTHSNTYSNGNLQVATSTSNAAFSHQRATFGLASGKWYWEITCQATSSAFYIVGITADTVNPDSQYIGQGNSYCYRSDTGQKATAGTFSSYGATFTTGDIIGVEFDADAGTLVFYKNGTSQGTAFTGISGTYFPAVSDLDNNTSRNSTFVANFGQRPFAYTPPTGFKSLNTYNLPDSTIEDGSEYFNTVLYTGTGSTNSITGVGFQPDWIWWKSRSAATSHATVNAVTGAKGALSSNNTSAEYTEGAGNGLLSFDSDGFTVGNDGNYTAYNQSGSSIVAWNWKANGSGVSNTDGSITSTVSANTTAGFSIVTYTGTGANATVGHGLGVAPSMIIVKKRTGTVKDWYVDHPAISAGNVVYLNLTAATAANATAFNSTKPTSAVFSLGANTGTNNSAESHVAYCFAEVEGYSKFGSYTGNGSADGPFVYTGFRPAFFMTKCTSTTSDWRIVDGTRDIDNPVVYELNANSSAAETTYSNGIDFNSNGVKIRETVESNTSGATYIYMAFAESPFKLSLAR